MSLSALAQKENNKTDLIGLDFSGSWILDEKNSYFLLDTKESYEDYVLEILQKEIEIKINVAFTYRGKESKYPIVLFSDKRGEENVQAFEQIVYSGLPRPTASIEPKLVWLENVNIKTKTSLNKDKLIRRGMFTISGINQILAEEYKLSNSGKTLSITSELHIQVSGEKMEKRRSNLIFQKKES